MRAAILALIAGCGAPPHAAAPSRTRAARTSCDFEDVTSSRRAWLTAGSSPVTVLDAQGGELLVATVRDDVMVTRWAPLEALAPVVTETTSVSPREGAPADPAVNVLAGFRLPAPITPWIPIRADRPVEITGFIPASARGLLWDEPAPTRSRPVHAEMIVRTGPSRDAAVRGVIHDGAQVRVIGVPTDRAPWFEILATGTRVSVTGFVEPPPPAPPSPPRSSEEEAAAEMEVTAPHGWLPIGTCLYDAPLGQIVGRVIGAVVDRPHADANGWSSIVVTTGWGDVRYHANAPVVEPPPAATYEDWPFSSEWREN